MKFKINTNSKIEEGAYDFLDFSPEAEADLTRRQEAYWSTWHYKLVFRPYHQAKVAKRSFRIYKDRLINRPRRGYALSDTWNLDHFLAGVIRGGVQQLIDNNLVEPPVEWYLIIAGFDVYENIDSMDVTENQQLLIDEAKQALADHFETLWD